jgi:predicted deacetylase
VKAPNWLPQGKRAAVCFTIDDVHPGKSSDAYEAGGDLEHGAMQHVEWLLERHPQLRVTLFVTADWREISPAVTRPLLAKVPVLRDKVYLTKVLPRGTMRLDRHPDFVAYLKSLPRTDVALHGLHHIHKGPRIAAEFFELNRAECEAMVEKMIAVFREAGLPYAPGMCPPSWEFSEGLAAAMIENGLNFVGSARDIRTPIAPDAVTAMSGIRGVSLIYPEMMHSGKLMHMTSNFQATSPLDRAIDIIDMHGLLGIKAHIVKNGCDYIALDGLDELYRNYLDVVLSELERRYGDSLWWASMAEIAAFASSRNVGEAELAACEV